MDAKQLRDRMAALVAEFDADQPSEILVRDGQSLYAALDAAPVGSTVRLEDGAQFEGHYRLTKPVTLVTGTAEVWSTNVEPALTITGDDVNVLGVAARSVLGASTNDLMVIRGARTRLTGVSVLGNDQTKRGIAANGRDMLFDHIRVDRIGRQGQESQAVAIWDGTGLTIRDSFLEAGSTPFLAGGASPTVPNHVPADILLENCTLTHPLEWRGQGYVNKTGFELKSGRIVTVRNCIIENCWKDGQTGFGITLTPSQYGNSPDTIVEDVLFDGCTIRNVASGANILGFTQHADRPTLRSRHLLFLNNTWVITGTANGGHGALMQLGRGPADLLWDMNTVTQDGTAFVRTTDSQPIERFNFRRNTLDVAGTYGLFLNGQTRGAGFAAAFPDGSIQENTIGGAHATFRTNFPINVWR